LNESPLAEAPMGPRHPRLGSGTRRISAGRIEGAEEDRVFREIERKIDDFGKRNEEDEKEIRDLLSKLDAVQINDLIYRKFAPHYDRHMEGHERAMDFILRQLTDLEAIGFGPANRLIHDDILEMSCGTGTVISLLCQALPPERLSRLHVTANDLSDEMKAIAADKLSNLPVQVEFSSQDLRWLSFPRNFFGTIILSQTLHLIADEEVVRQERESNYMFIDEDRHLNEKFQAVLRSWNLLPEGGTFIVIDEWPALLSDRGGPLGQGFAYLFNDTLRGIDIRTTFHDSIMEQMPGSRFVAQLKVPIDARHQMYLLVYQKELYRHDPKLPAGPDSAVARFAASEKLFDIFRKIDGYLIESVNPSNGETPWVKLLPIDRDVKVISGTDYRPSEESAYNCVIVGQCLHRMEKYDRISTISSAIRSLKKGGTLILMDEWPPPEGSPHPLRRSSLRVTYMPHFTKHVVFAGSVRLPISEGYGSGMYGFQYRKVF
jgi:ubiquinone/menaquinone biosynthesis C-methylase UbiE